MTKVTKSEMFAMVAEMAAEAGREDILEFATKEMATLKARAEKGRGMTATQKDNEVLKGALAEALAEMGEPVTATDVANIADITVQKASPILRQMVAAGTLIRTEGKGKTKTTFAVA